MFKPIRENVFATQLLTPVGVLKLKRDPAAARVFKLSSLLLLWLVLGAVLNLAYAADPPEAIGSLFSQDPQKYLCTATVVAGEELGLEQELAILTAAHCVEKSLKKDKFASAWSTDGAYEVTFNSQDFFEVYPHRVGYAKKGYDLAVMLFVDAAPDIAPLHMGAWDQVDFGSYIQNFANPLGMGIQYFTGAITMMHIEPSPINKKPQWHHNAVASVQVGPGSSGSLILNDAQEYVGVLSGVMEARFGSPFTIFVPQWRFEDFMADDAAARDLECSACQLHYLAVAKQMGKEVVIK